MFRLQTRIVINADVMLQCWKVSAAAEDSVMEVKLNEYATDVSHSAVDKYLAESRRFHSCCRRLQ